MNLCNIIWIERNPVILNVSIDAFVTPLDTIDLFYLVVKVETHNKLTNNHVQTWAKTTTSHYACLGFDWVTKEPFFWARFFKLYTVCYICVRFINWFCSDEVIICQKRPLGQKVGSTKDIDFHVITE